MISRDKKIWIYFWAALIAGMFAENVFRHILPETAIILISTVFFSIASKFFIEYLEHDIIPQRKYKYLRPGYPRTALVIMVCVALIAANFNYMVKFIGSFFGQTAPFERFWGEFIIGVIAGMLWNEYGRIIEDRKKIENV